MDSDRYASGTQDHDNDISSEFRQGSCVAMHRWLAFGAEMEIFILVRYICGGSRLVK